MKALCLVSSLPGHMDFGGMGYLKLAKTLRDRGHEIVWVTTGEQVDRIRANGFQCVNCETLEKLHFRRILDCLRDGTILETIVEGIADLQALLIANSPSVVLSDRVLACVALPLEELKVPYVSVGTPGGSWCC